MAADTSHYRLMTYNIGGSRRHPCAPVTDAAEVIKEVDPDILGLQEATAWTDASQAQHSAADIISGQVDRFRGIYYGPTMSMNDDFHVGKSLFVDAIFSDYHDWSQGNALLSHWNFARLGDPSLDGTAANIPIFRPIQYEGNRDTDPRNAVLARVRDGVLYPYVIVTHLTALRGEHERGSIAAAQKREEAIAMRHKQVLNLLVLIRDRLLRRGEIVFLMGDFNADVREMCLQELVQAGFIHLLPINHETPTHSPRGPSAIDHIFIYPASRLVQFECRVVDTPIARRASDHLPVVADVVVRSA